MIAAPATSSFLTNMRNVKHGFPIFDPQGPNSGLVYLDTAASAQKPAAVIEAVDRFYRTNYANIHRGVYRLSAAATEAYEGARHRVARFIHAPSPETIIFTRGATEAINLVAASWAMNELKAGDQILITALEHHANIVPWQMVRDRLGIELLIAPLLPDNGLDVEAFQRLLSSRLKLVALTHISNAIGTVTPLAELIRLAQSVGARVLVDGAQAVSHRPVDVIALGCDFYTFSAHKTYGPTGIGVLYGKAELLAAMPPYQTGGDMISRVTFEHSEFQDPPQRFEAGTPDIAGAVGLAAALDYIDGLGWDYICAHERDVLHYGVDRLTDLSGVTVIEAGAERSGVISFTVDGIHPHDLGTLLDRHHIAVRAGNHCAQPLLALLGVYATARASVGIYNERSDFDALADGIIAAQNKFGM